MKVSEIASKLGLQVVSGREGLENEVISGYVSDLLSDVMGNAEQGMVWITLQTHKNTIAVASLKELAAIIVIGGNKPNDDAIAQSDIEHIPVMITNQSCFDVSGKLYQILSNGTL